jgi:rhodanese-related sulfurtransferase
VAEFLAQHGYRAAALRGGFDAWKQQGYQTEPIGRRVQRAA